MRKLTLIVALAFAVVVGVTITTIALAQDDDQTPDPLEYLVLAFTDAYERDTLEEWLPGLLADIVVESYIAPETGETPEQVRQRLIAEFQATPTAQPSLALKFDPDGPDRDCSDFTSWQDAQAFFWATVNDSHDLDPDNDGVACETLPGAPEAEVVVVTPTPVAGTEITISGTGTATRAITLIPGLWIVDIELTDNESCDAQTDSCRTEVFTVEIDAVNEADSKLLAAEFEVDWTGSTTLRVGDGLFEHASGPQIVSVDAYGDWSITFTKQ